MTDPTTAEGRAELHRICDAATPRPWEACQEDDGSGADYAWRVDGPPGHYSLASGMMPSEAAFIAVARTALPAALDRIEDLERELAEARKTRIRVVKSRPFVIVDE